MRAGANWASSSVVSLPFPYPGGPYNNYAPTVAMGGPAVSLSYPLDGSNYNVAHFIDDGSGDDIVMMEPIDYSSSSALETPPNEYFWVSQLTPASTSGNYASAITSSANVIALDGLVGWAYPHGGGSRIYYKFAFYPYAFRSAASSVGNVAAQKIQVYPNPATNELRVVAGNEATSYSITDMAGRVLASGPVQPTTNINVAALEAGTYVLQLYKEGRDAGNMLFEKSNK